MRQNIHRHYTPDFAVLLDNGTCFITEVKHSYNDMLDGRVHEKLEAMIKFCENSGMGLLLTNGRHSVNYLRNYPYRRDVEAVIQNKLDEGNGETISFAEFKKIKDKYNLKTVEFLAMVFKNNWGYYSFPFNLTLKSQYSLFRKKVINRLK
ncbi:hypothetical protein BDD43_0859 [Mucilaginibacter gracilis]|uniref:Uncharacterized protein n=1 Tax=Mucilaginibacter gracilis TaxID=423350 RepID=A0A495IVE0_9SPHI|nr:hypothetical protein BDD43_0859 [Mucilaginibacter gracilis]